MCEDEFLPIFDQINEEGINGRKVNFCLMNERLLAGPRQWNRAQAGRDDEALL